MAVHFFKDVIGKESHPKNFSEKYCLVKL